MDKLNLDYIGCWYFLFQDNSGACSTWPELGSNEELEVQPAKPEVPTGNEVLHIVEQDNGNIIENGG